MNKSGKDHIIKEIFYLLKTFKLHLFFKADSYKPASFKFQNAKVIKAERPHRSLSAFIIVCALKTELHKVLNI